MPSDRESKGYKFFGEKKNNVNRLPVYGHYKKMFARNWKQSKIHHDIGKALDKIGIHKMRPIQQNSFPYLSKNYNTAMIGSSEGKSTSYLTNILSSIRKKKKIYYELNKLIRPRAIILTSSVDACTTLGDLTKELLSSVKRKYNIKVIVAYTSIDMHSTVISCYGCDIIISTPACFRNLLNNSTNYFDWSKVRHFVLDNIDLLLDNYKDEMFNYSINLSQLKTRRHLQFISASINWNVDVHVYLSTLFDKWQYIFGCHLQAARYMNTGFNVVQVKNNKLEQILKVLTDNYKNYRRCVIMTTNTDEIGMISSYIKQDSNIEVLLLQKNRDDAHTWKKWEIPLNNPKRQLVLICNDEMMSNMYIDNADCLIHYDIPVDVNTFTTRFSVLQTGSTKRTRKKDYSSHIFLGNNINDERRIPKVVEIMQMFGSSEIEPVLLKQAKVINVILENENKNSPFCSSIQQFGYCSMPRKCPYRHIFMKELDEPALNIPKMGLVAIQILNVYNASHISAKLLYVNCTKNHDEVHLWSKVEDHSDSIKHELKTFYSNPNSRIVHVNPQLGDVVAVPFKNETDDIVYRRAIIIEICKSNNSTPLQLKVKLIDEGCIEIIPKSTVLVLPDVLKNIQTTTVDIFLASVKPLDFAREWSVRATTFIKSQIKNAVENLYIAPIVINVEMALGTTIWVSRLFDNDLNLREKYEFEIIISDMLLNFGHAEINDDHLEILIELSISAGIDTPLALKSSNELDIKEFMALYKLPQPQWLNLDQSGLMLLIGNIITPKHFYVRNSKSNSSYDKLQESINNVVEYELVENLKYIAIGGICLGKRPGTFKYNRVQIIKILNYRLVEVLFVDFGEIHTMRHDSFLTINEHLITSLPFQAVECGLSGVKDTLPTDNQLQELINYVFDLTRNRLCLIIIDQFPEKYDGSSHYEVLLFNDIITVNLEFHNKFSQYCDYSEISTLVYLINEQNILKENYSDANCVNETKLKDSISNIQFIDTLDTQEDIDVMNTCDSKIESKENIMMEKQITKITPEIQKNPCLSCNNYHQITVPFCTWFQDKNNIYIKLNISNIDNSSYKINSTTEAITFLAKFNNKLFSFYALLFDIIINNNTKYAFSKDGLHIKAEKLYKTGIEWPRLLACDKQHNFLEYNLGYKDTTDLISFTEKK